MELSLEISDNRPVGSEPFVHNWRRKIGSGSNSPWLNRTIALAGLAKSAQGDLRSAINDLQSLSMAKSNLELIRENGFKVSVLKEFPGNIFVLFRGYRRTLNL